MTTPDDVLNLFQQLYEAEQQLAMNIERERQAACQLQGCVLDRKAAEDTLERLRERMQRLARKAAGVPEPVDDRAEVRREFQPVTRY